VNPLAARFCRHCGRPVAEPPIRSATRSSPLMKQWRMLRQRMTRKEVRQFLGEPLRIEWNGHSDSAHETWVYEYEIANKPGSRLSGSVSFSATEGTTVLWTEPDWTAAS
jgi:hypothetical protein